MITFTTDYNEKELRNLMINTSIKRNSKLRFLLLLLALVAFIWLLILPLSLDLVIPGLLLLLFLLLVQKPVHRKIYKVYYNEILGEDGKIEYTVDEDGIQSHDATRDSHYDWSYFQSSEIIGDFFLLKSQGGQSIFCRISQLSPHDFEAFQALADEHI